MCTNTTKHGPGRAARCETIPWFTIPAPGGRTPAPHGEGGPPSGPHSGPTLLPRTPAGPEAGLPVFEEASVVYFWERFAACLTAEEAEAGGCDEELFRNFL
jgi:hypothetical protein